MTVKQFKLFKKVFTLLKIYLFAVYRKDRESKEAGSQLPFIDIDGFDPGEFVDHYKEHLNPGLDEFFQKPQRQAKHFNIHSNDCKIYYEKSKVGPNPMGQMLPYLTEALGLQRATNAQLRTTAIVKMSRARFSDR